MGKENHSISSKDNKPLIVGLNKFGEIIQFNKECQRLTHYSRNDVIYRNIMDFLIPTSHLNKWKEMVDLTLKNGEIKDFIIPWKTSKGKEVLISWNINFVTDRKSKNGDISYVGEIVDSDYEKSLVKTNEIFNEDKNEELFFKELKENKYGETEENKNNKTKTKKYNKFFKNKEKIDDLERNKNGGPKNLEKAFKKLTKKYENLYIKINELEKNNKKIEQRLNEFNETLQNQKIPIEDKKDSFIEFMDVDERNNNAGYPDTFETTDEQINIFSSDNDINKKQEELARFEAKLIEDRKNLDKRVIELSRWKEKLLELESEIEKRRSDLVAQESEFLQNLASTPNNKTNQGINYSDTIIEKISDSDSEQQALQNIFDKITNCAVIIQRGTLKKVNQSFAELLGYNINEIVNKSLFDFISPEGFPVIEKYYLDRLKGVESSGYGIILLTKDNIEMPVKVSTRPTIFNGDKAEIAIFNTQDQTQNNTKNNESDEVNKSAMGEEVNLSNNEPVENIKNNSSEEEQLTDEGNIKNQNENNIENGEMINDNSNEEQTTSEDENKEPKTNSESTNNKDNK